MTRPNLFDFLRGETIGSFVGLTRTSRARVYLSCLAPLNLRIKRVVASVKYGVQLEAVSNFDRMVGGGCFGRSISIRPFFAFSLVGSCRTFCTHYFNVSTNRELRIMADKQ